MKTLLTLAAAIAVATAPALAQTSVSTPPAFLGPSPADGGVEWTPRVSAQTVRALGSPSPVVRLRALYTVATLAYDPPGRVDLRPAVPALLHLFQTDADARLRIMALRLLEATGGDDVMTALRAEVGPEARRPMDLQVRRTLLAVLVDHYGADTLRLDRAAVSLAKSLPATSR